ncbi:hypothetical protein GGR52DRAFT_591937 [Hypoxylon sp. FL1284]|nr:hypothetical protein GGR52DRAFT_591937 [Hypoxylon sp. FL1284]
MIEIRESPGKGLGIFATRDIERGERLFRDTALISLNEVEDSSVWWKHLYQKFRDLSLEDQSKYLSLSWTSNQLTDGLDPIRDYLAFDFGFKDQTLESETQFVVKLMVIYSMNSTELGPGAEHGSGVFPTYARINHSCVPNAQWEYIHDSRAVEACPNRLIKAGEEITISYIPLAKPIRVRAPQLAVYSFQCDCAACEGPGSADSNRQRETMQVIDAIFELHRDPEAELPGVFIPDGFTIPEQDGEDYASLLAMGYVDLALKEGLVGATLVQAYERAGWFYDLLGDQEESEEAYELAEEHRLVFPRPA